MNNYPAPIEQGKHDTDLGIFLDATDEELQKKLKLLEKFDDAEDYSVDKFEESALAGFHPESVRMIIKDDDYYLGRRANHFVLIFGWSEAFGYGNGCVVCLANHKGSLCVTVFTFINEGETQDI